MITKKVNKIKWMLENLTIENYVNIIRIFRGVFYIYRRKYV